MGPQQEPGWQKRSRAKSCGECYLSNSFSQRRQSAPSVILSKALTKSKPISRDGVSQVDVWALIQSLLGPNRKLISQGNVLLQTGLQTQERFLILFSDLLVITKAKSVMQVKQKACVAVKEMWTAACVDEVCESNTEAERSFVMGWPTHNCVATFSSSEEKDRWLCLLDSCIKEAKQCDDPKMIPFKIFTKDVGNCAYAKTLFISNTDSASDVISTALTQFGLPGGTEDYQLWVCSKRDDTPYPLIGHEYPYSIKMSHVRLMQQDTSASASASASASHNQVALFNIDTHCQFFLRPSRTRCPITEQKSSRRRRMSLIGWAFKRGCSVDQAVQSESSNSPDHAITSGHLFARPLSEIINANTLPSPILDMIVCLCNEGAATRGIFRRSAGVKACRELREKLNSGHQEEVLSGESVLVTAAVLKDFLRSLPNSLLRDELYEQWMRGIERDGDKDVQLREVQRLIQLLPKENLLLLRHVIAMLHHIHLNAEHNQMNSFNLAVCIAPSLLWNCSVKGQEKDAKKVCDLVNFLIANCCALFGDDILNLLKDLTEENRSKYGSVGSLQHLSDSGCESLKNEVNTDSEELSKSVPFQDSHSTDSLVSLSDCELDQSESAWESPPSAHQSRGRPRNRHQSREKDPQRENPDDNVFVENRAKLTQPRGKHASHILRQSSSPVFSLTHSATPTQRTLSSAPSPPQPPAFHAIGCADHHQPIVEPTQSSRTLSSAPSPTQPPALHAIGCADRHQPIGFQHVQSSGTLSSAPSPPPALHAIGCADHHQPIVEATQSRRPPTHSLRPVPKERGVFYKGPVTPPTRSRSVGAKRREEVRLPQSVFYGQSSRLTVHKVRELTSTTQQDRACPATDARPLGQEVKGVRRARCCRSGQWVV